ncbi:formate dehydrogenase accessory protein FdhE [Effusibacillus lacus]|uniref:FdhE central domain-containing protein n=1 Tax=Effusibacillus lacus TaxID=1348429 RepID=A0A292YJ37_9BACL|nr:formate dehydrogenase accessory protein FdhE [Effusibacillus lacus]TCS71428.1 FdhE protein [Effusibacillus lacus]GAX89958.1 hypothetical protein EFBL_1584 [Effusibacillus lacus]
MAAKSNVVESVKKRWRQLIDKDRQYKDIAKVHTDLVERMEKHVPKITPFSIEKEEVLAKLEAGTPLLEGKEDQVELRYAVALFRELTDWAGTGDARKKFKKWEKGLSDAHLEQVLRGWIKGDLEPFTRVTLGQDLPQDLLSVLIQYSLLPTLHSYGSALVPDKAFLLEKWQHGYCPFCGDTPALAEIRDTERFRYLRCTSCGGDWPFKRIACPACGNNDHEKLETFMMEDPKTGAQYQIDVCEVCKNYVKVSNKLQPSPPAMLLLDDLSTTHLDLFAVENGYYKGGKPDGTLQ